MPQFDEDVQLPQSIEPVYTDGTYGRSRAYGPVRTESSDEGLEKANWPLGILTGRPDLVVRDRSRAIFQKGTLLPFATALALTFLPALALLIYVLVFRVGTVFDCKKITGSCDISQGTLLLSDPVQRFLTVTKVVDTVLQLATVWTITLAAYVIADTWLRSSDNPLTNKTLALVVNMYASGRWWTLYDTAVSLYKKTAKVSKPFVQAVTMLVVTLVLAKCVTGVDFWLHYVSKEAALAYGSPRQLVDVGNRFMFSRKTNHDCYPNTALGELGRGIDYPCTLTSSGAITQLTFPSLSAALALNQSTTDSVALVYGDSDSGNQTVMSILTPPSSNRDYNYNASTIGMSASCRSVTKECGFYYVPHGSGGYNCSSLGEVNLSDTISFALYPGVLEYRSVDLASRNMSSNANQTGVMYYLLGLVSANTTNSTVFANAGDSVVTMQRCEITPYYINYTAAWNSEGELDYKITSKSVMSTNDSSLFTGPFTQTTGYMGDALSASRGAAQISGSEFDRIFTNEIARYSLVYGAGAWTSQPTTEVAELAPTRLYTLVPIAPLALFFAFAFLYSIFIIILFFMTLPTGRTTIMARDASSTDAQEVTVTSLTQRRLVRTDFLLHQLLSSDERKSTTTDADNIFKGEEDTPVNIGIDELQGRFGVFANGQESPMSVRRNVSQIAVRKRSVHKSPPRA